MKLKLAKLSAADLVAAARGQFEVDITSEMLKAMGMDEEATTLGLLTKGEGVGNSKTDELLQAIKAGVDALIAAATAQTQQTAQNTEAIKTAAAPLQPNGDLTKVVDDLRAQLATSKSDMAKAIEQMVQLTATVEAMKGEAAKKPPEAAPTTGVVTPAMEAFLRQQMEAVNGQKSESFSQFPFDALAEIR